MTNAATIHTPERQKELGAFYTPPEMAAALTKWAVRDAGDRVLDPSFGGLVFLSAARERLEQLGAGGDAIAEQVFGVDVDPEAQVLANGDPNLGLGPRQILERDFFEVAPGDLPQMDALVGNPPYIRYQGFNGSAQRARELSAQAGVKLTKLASSWASFVVHGSSFVAPAGRLAQVLPAELLHSQYASEVIEFLKRAYGRIQIVVFEERVFPGALEEVVLLLADERAAPKPAVVQLISCRDVNDVSAGLARGAQTEPEASNVANGRGKLLAQLLPTETRALYDRLAALDGVKPLGDFASVDIGIVTGANDFFMLSEEQAAGLNPRLLARGVTKAAHVAGARLSEADHEGLLRVGNRALMLVASGDTPKAHLNSARQHIDEGERDGLDQRYKCRIRDPWWALPVPKQGIAALLLTYCSNEHPRLALNEAGALSTNTLHGVRPRDEREASLIAAGFYNSLTLLSAEIVGRSYGGGVLKLEPSEAEALLIPGLTAELEEILPAVDEAIRGRDIGTAVELVDDLVLRPLGLNDADLDLLRSGRRQLAARRKRRGRPPK